MIDKHLTLNKVFKGHTGSVYDLATDDEQYFYSVGGDGWIVQWDLSGGTSNGLLIAKSDSKLFSSCLLWDKNTLLTGDMYGLLYWIDIKNKEILSVVKGHQSSIFDMYQISDETLITASKDGYICLWDIATKHPVYSYKINYKGLRCIEANMALDTIYLGGSDHNIYLFSLIQRNVIDSITSAHENSIFTILNLDDEALITGGRDAHMNEWHLSNPLKRLQSLPAHWYTINSIVDMPSMGLIASGSRDKTIRTWDRETLQSVQVIDVQKGGHINSVNKLLWSKKFRTLISASDDRTIRTWKTGTQND